MIVGSASESVHPERNSAEWDEQTDIAAVNRGLQRSDQQHTQEGLLAPSTSDRTVAFAIIDLLEQAGVEYIFAVPGGPLTGLFEALTERRTIRLVIAKHESGAAFMAASYARVSGKLAVCIATSGPGATNALTGITSAMCDSLPVLLLTGQVSTTVFGKGAIQESSAFGVDVVSIFRPVTKLSVMAVDPAQIPDMLQMGIRTARSGRTGPVHLSLPANMLRAPTTVVKKVPLDLTMRPCISGPEVEQISSELLQASRLCIVAGHGVALSQAHAALKDVAELTSAQVVTSPKGKGTFEEVHPLSRGVLGFGGHDEAAALFTKEADVVLIVGSSMNEFVTNAWSLSPASNATVIQVDIDPVSLGKNYKTDIVALGDAGAVLEAVAAHIRKTAPRHRKRKNLATSFSVPRPESGEAHKTLKPRVLIDELRKAMPDDALLFVDNGNSILWATHYFEIRQPHTYFIDLGLASMGSAVAGVVGGASAAGDRYAVALVGDSAFAMHGFEVHTAVENELAAIWIVLNDGGHGMVRHGDTLMHGAPLGVSDFRVMVDVAKAAQSMGAHSHLVTSREELRTALHTAFRRKGPTVIDARIDPEEIAPSLIRRVRSLSEMFAAGESEDPGDAKTSGTFRSPLGE